MKDGKAQAEAEVKTKAGERARTISDDSIIFKLIRVVNLTARPFSESIGQSHHLSLTEWRVLVVLANHPRVAASEVAAFTGLDKMSVSRALAVLVRRGRVVRTVDSADKRRLLLRLSAEGERLYERIGVPARERERSLWRGMARSEMDLLGGLLDRLMDNLAAADDQGK